MKFAADRPFADPDKAARKLLELANAAEADRDQRIAIELINLPFLRAGGSADEYRAAIERANRQRLAMAARIRSLREVHRGWRGPVRLMKCSLCEVNPSAGEAYRPLSRMVCGQPEPLAHGVPPGHTPSQKSSSP